MAEMEESAMQQQTATQSGELDSLDMDAEHVMPPELPTQDSALEDSVGQLSRVQNKLVDTLHALQLLLFWDMFSITQPIRRV